jgi:O-antigen/teichoic acid export membrane protein
MSRADGTTKRLIKGTGVTWIRLGITILAQIVATPVYLHYWSAETYGSWLLIMAAIGFLQIPGTSFQNYIGFELMRESTRDRSRFSTVLVSSIRFGALYGIFELTVAGFLSVTVVPGILGPDASDLLRSQASQTFFFMALGSGLVWNWGGMWVRGANATGYYARGAGWGVADGLVRVLTPLIALSLGFGMPGAALGLAVSLMILHQFTVRNLRKFVRLEMIPDARVDLRLARMAFRHSQMLSLKSGLEMLRQQGIRLILAPLMGTTLLAAFASMRTFANAALQGLNSITNPLMPELMRFLSKRDQVRSEAAMGTVWMIVIAMMVPMFVILQVIAADFFHWWTRGKIAFDAPFFAIISTCVLVFASAQPAGAIVRGNNLLKIQFVNSLLAGIIAVVGSLLLGSKFGLLGVGIALLLAEVTSAIGFRIAADQWMEGNGLAWPTRASISVSLAVLLGAVAMGLIAWIPSSSIWVVIAFVPLISLLVFDYIRNLPEMAITRIRSLGMKLPIARYLVKYV